MDAPLSAIEMKRRAPMHFWAKADNARVSARYLWDATEASMKDSATEIGYNSSTKIAAYEAFIRESSLALELIIKAVIARRIEQRMAMAHVKRVRATHELPELWKDAQLPKLEKPEQLHLHLASIALRWAGRYAAPLRDEEYWRNIDTEKDFLETDDRVMGIKLLKPQPMEWHRFDKIYSTASDLFWKLREQWEQGSKTAI